MAYLVFHPQCFVARRFKDHHGAVDVYDRDSGDQAKLGTEGLRQSCDHITMLVSIPCSTIYIRTHSHVSERKGVFLSYQRRSLDTRLPVWLLCDCISVFQMSWRGPLRAVVPFLGDIVHVWSIA